MRNVLPFALQGAGAVSALALAVFGPQPGRASQLLPLNGETAAQSAHLTAQWASREDARLVAFDTSTGRATVIAPSAISLARALTYGLVPIASAPPSCTVASAPKPAKRAFP
ncbi:MAG: hypothetical protein AAF291_12170 [Pseudomonadota bacterium]